MNNEQLAIAVCDAMIIADQYHLKTGDHYVVVLDENHAISIELETDIIDVSRDYLYCTDPDLDDRITGCDDDYTH